MIAKAIKEQVGVVMRLVCEYGGIRESSHHLPH
jgi:hypothetical protein